MAIETWQWAVMAVFTVFTIAFLALVWYRRRQLSSLVNEHRFNYKTQKMLESRIGESALSIIDMGASKADVDSEVAVDSAATNKSSEKYRAKVQGVYKNIGCYQVLGANALDITKNWDTFERTGSQISSSDGIIFVVQRRRDRIRVMHPCQGWADMKDPEGKPYVKKVAEATLLDDSAVSFLSQMFERYSEDQIFSEHGYIECINNQEYDKLWSQYSFDEAMYWPQFFRLVLDLRKKNELAGFLNQMGYDPHTDYYSATPPRRSRQL